MYLVLLYNVVEDMRRLCVQPIEWLTLSTKKCTLVFVRTIEYHLELQSVPLLRESN